MKNVKTVGKLGATKACQFCVSHNTTENYFHQLNATMETNIILNTVYKYSCVVINLIVKKEELI